MPKGEKKKRRRGKDGASSSPSSQYARREWPGFEPTRPVKFKVPSIDKVVIRHYPLAPNTDRSQEVLTFSFTTGPHELVRLLPLPVRVKYKVRQKNVHAAGHKYDTSPAQPWQDKDWFYTHPLSKEGTTKKALGAAGSADAGKMVRAVFSPKAYIDPFAPTQAFFESATVMLDGEDVTEQLKRQGVWNGFTAYAQRCFMSSGERLRYYGTKGYVGTSEDWEALDEVTSHEARETLKLTDFGAYNQGAQPRVIDLGFEGVPFLGYPKNFLLSKLAGVDPPLSWGILPPSTKVVVQLRRPSPTGKYLEQHTVAVNAADNSKPEERQMDQKEFFTDGNMSNAPMKTSVDIEDVHLGVEVLKFHPASSKAMLEAYSRPRMSYFFDYHDMQVQRVLPSQKEATVVFSIDKCVKLAVLSFAFQPNVYYTESKKHNLSYRSVLPANLESLRITFMGEPLIAEELGSLSSADTAESVSAAALRQYQTDRGWTDKNHPEDLVPRGGEVKSYKAMLPLDLSAFSPDGARELVVTMAFNDTMSPAGAAGAVRQDLQRGAREDVAAQRQDGLDDEVGRALPAELGGRAHTCTGTENILTAGKTNLVLISRRRPRTGPVEPEMEEERDREETEAEAGAAPPPPPPPAEEAPSSEEEEEEEEEEEGYESESDYWEHEKLRRLELELNIRVVKQARVDIKRYADYEDRPSVPDSWSIHAKRQSDSFYRRRTMDWLTPLASEKTKEFLDGAARAHFCSTGEEDRLACCYCGLTVSNYHESEPKHLAAIHLDQASHCPGAQLEAGYKWD